MSQQLDKDGVKKHLAELCSIIGRAPWAMLYCQECHPTNLPSVNNLSQHFEYYWAVTVTCFTCIKQWNIYTKCDSRRTPMVDEASLYNHYYKKHCSTTNTSDQEAVIQSHHTVEERKKQAELRYVTGRATLSVLYCLNCHTSQLPPITNEVQHVRYSWAVTLLHVTISGIYAQNVHQQENHFLIVCLYTTIITKNIVALILLLRCHRHSKIKQIRIHGGAAQAQKKGNGRGRLTTPATALQLMRLITLMEDLLSHIKLLVNPKLLLVIGTTKGTRLCYPTTPLNAGIMGVFHSY
jgi:hypothetical protein